MFFAGSTSKSQCTYVICLLFYIFHSKAAFNTKSTLYHIVMTSTSRWTCCEKCLFMKFSLKINIIQSACLCCRNILYGLNRKTQGFAILKASVEDSKQSSMNQSLSQVFSSICSAEKLIQSGLELFENDPYSSHWNNHSNMLLLIMEYDEETQ